MYMIRLKEIVKEMCPLMEYNADIQAPPAITRPNVPAPTKAAKVYSQQEIRDAYLIAATLWKEARGEGTKGMIAVMNVIQNRTKNRYMGAKSMRDVILQPKQFSCWLGTKNHDLETERIAKSGKDSNEFKMALQIVQYALEGKLNDITHGSMYYTNPSQGVPKWARKMKVVLKLGQHHFYKES